jgi:hypothetical protein
MNTVRIAEIVGHLRQSRLIDSRILCVSLPLGIPLLLVQGFRNLPPGTPLGRVFPLDLVDSPGD